MSEESRPISTTSAQCGWMQITTDIASHLPFSAAVEANGFVFVSGQASVDRTAPSSRAASKRRCDGRCRT